MRSFSGPLAVTLLAALAGAGCKGDSGKSGPDAATTSPAQTELTARTMPALGEPVTPTGTVHEVTIVADSGRFDPAALTVKQGDVVKFTLGSGACNVHFPPGHNSGVVLPQASDVMSAHGQSFSLVIGAPAGTYTFQCDQPAAHGMSGTITVQ